MIVLGYIGKHKGQGLRAWLGWALIRTAQVGRTWRRVTHTEILLRGDWQHATIGSSSLIDGGVRQKTTPLNPDHWVAIEVPDGKLRTSAPEVDYWFEWHDGIPYDTRGAVGSVLYGFGHSREGYFCNEACGAAMKQTDPHKMPPAGFIAWCMDIGGVDVTAEFFGGRDA